MADDRRQTAKPQGPGPRRASALDKSGRVQDSKLRENQNALNVGPDHKTADMKKRHRGTFP